MFNTPKIDVRVVRGAAVAAGLDALAALNELHDIRRRQKASSSRVVQRNREAWEATRLAERLAALDRQLCGRKN